MSILPLYGFLAGDTVGILLLARPDETLGELAARLQQSARLRVAPCDAIEVWHRGRALDLSLPVAAARLEPLDRIDVKRLDARPRS